MTAPSAQQWYSDGRYWVSPFNFEPAVAAARQFPDPLVLYDSTIRKILYTPGISPTTKQILAIAELLDDLGIREMLLNLHWWGEPEPERKELEACTAVLGAGFSFHTTIYAEAGVPDPSGASAVDPAKALALVRSLGADSVELTFRVPADDETFKRHVHRWIECARLARQADLTVVLSIADVARADPEKSLAIAREATRAGVARIQLMDSYSSLAPDALAWYCRWFRAELGEPVELMMHVHNDFGLGTALALAAITSGVNPDVSLNSYSYRAGFAALEEVALAVETLYGVSSGLRLDRLVGTARKVGELIGLPPYPIKAVIGDHAFLRDTPPAMLAYLANGPDAFPPPNSCVAPSLVGGRLHVVWGHHHASAVIRAKLEQMGLAATDSQLAHIVREVADRQASLQTYPQWLSETDIEGICREAVSTA